MKTALLFCLVLPICLARSIKLDADSKLIKLLPAIVHRAKLQGRASDEVLNAIVDEYADQVFQRIDEFIINDNLDPTNLPDVHETFEHEILFITYHGELDLTSGFLADISTIQRDGDVVLTYSDKTLLIHVPITFNDLTAQYEYKAKIMDIGPSGEVDGKIKNVQMLVELNLDFQNFLISLSQYEVISTGHIELTFHGNSLLDWLLDIISNIVTAVMKSTLLNKLEDIVKGGLDYLCDALNDYIQNALNPPSMQIYKGSIPIIKT